MEKKAIIISSVASMIEQFNMPNIKLLQDMGYKVTVACNFENGSTITKSQIDKMLKLFSDEGIETLQIPIPRKISDIKNIFKSISLLKKISMENYNIMHCHSPIGSVVARLAFNKARKKGTRVIYTAHGFHFYKGAPKKNWLVFYPIEKICTLFTDILITINKEDYSFAKKHFKNTNIEYLPGVGIDLKKFSKKTSETNKRRELSLKDDDIILFSVGELNQNKNHEVIIKALGKLQNKKIHYLIAGIGDKHDYLLQLSKEENVNLHLLGYRTDVKDLYAIADIFVFPSYREGLSVSLMEAMSIGLPCIVSRIRGNVDLIDDNLGGFLCQPDDINDFKNKINFLLSKKEYMHNFSTYNLNKIKNFGIDNVMILTKKIYLEGERNEKD